MKAKLTFLTGAALGYVLGTRAGRESYEKIKSSAKAAWSKDAVQETVATVQDTVKTQAGEVVHKLVQQVHPSDSSDSSDASNTSDSPESAGKNTSLTSDMPDSETSLYGEGGNPLDIVPEVSDEFPDAGLAQDAGQHGNNTPKKERPVTGV